MAYRKPKRFFEKSGSVDPASSYYVMLENVSNTDNQNIKTMMDRGRYFSIFAPRQSGKTTFVRRFFQYLHQDPTYVAVFLSFETYSNVAPGTFYAQVQKYLYQQLAAF